MEKTKKQNEQINKCAMSVTNKLQFAKFSE